MSDAYAIRIADAVKSSLNTAVGSDSFSRSDFTVERRYADWDLGFEDLGEGEMDVVVVYRSMMENELQTRGHLRHDHVVHVAIRKRFAPSDRDFKGRLLPKSVDPLVTLLEDFYKHFMANRNSTVLADDPTVKIDGQQAPMRFNQQALRQGLFEGFIELTFKARETI